MEPLARNPRRHGPFAAGCVVLLLVLAFASAWAAWRPDPAVARHASPKAGPGLDFVSGERRDYDVCFETCVDDARGDRVFGQTIHGRMQIVVRGLTAAVVRMSVQLAALEVEIDGRRDETLAAAMAGCLDVDLAFDGHVLRVVAGTAGDAVANRRVEELLRYLQCVVPNRDAATWRSPEQHGAGAYLAEYRRDGDALHKRKLRYQGGTCADSSGEVRVLASMATFQIDAGRSWISGCALQESLACEQHGQSVVVHTLASLCASDAPAPAGSARLRPATGAPVLSAGTRIAAEAAATQPLTPRREAELRAVVEGLARLGRSDPQVSARLLALLRQTPALAGLIPGWMLTESWPAVCRASLLHALERAGHGEAQTALSSILQDRRHAPHDRLRAAIAAAGLVRPDASTVAALRSQAFSSPAGDDPRLAATSALALGSLGNALRENEPRQYEGLCAELIAALHRSPDRTTRRSLLGALQNTGDPRLAGAIAPYLADPSAGVRADAARALGRMDAPETHRLLRERLLADPDAHVRARLAESLERIGAPTDDDLQTALLALRRETGERAQASLARLLADHLVRIPEAEADLTRMLDGSERLRRDLAMRDFGILRERRSGGARVAPAAGRR